MILCQDNSKVFHFCSVLAGMEVGFFSAACAVLCFRSVADSTQMFSLLLSSARCSLLTCSLFSHSVFPASKLGRARSYGDTELGQLMQTMQRDIPYLMTSEIKD